jgi:hypothetical protein
VTCFHFMVTWILYGCALLLSVDVYMLLFTKLCCYVNVSGYYVIDVVNGHVLTCKGSLSVI